MYVEVRTERALVGQGGKYVGGLYRSFDGGENRMDRFYTVFLALGERCQIVGGTDQSIQGQLAIPSIHRLHHDQPSPGGELHPPLLILGSVECD